MSPISRSRSLGFGVAAAMGALGTLAVCLRLAIRRLAIQRVAIDKATLRSLEIETLTVARLRVADIEVTGHMQLPGDNQQRRMDADRPDFLTAPRISFWFFRISF